MDLNTIWFLLLGVLITGYAILDGFDLGVGVLFLFARNEEERRIYLNAIGPVWDGNEVWLLTGGGALFAAFPIVYATVFSAFYLAMMLLVTALIARAVSFEFRGKLTGERWKKLWDWCFGLLNPFALLCGLVGVAMFTMQGAAYMALKTEGELRERMRDWTVRGWTAFVVLYAVATAASILAAPHAFVGLLGKAAFWIILLLFAVAAVLVPVESRRERYGRAFLMSSLSIAALIGLAAVGLFPRLVPSSINLAYSLTIYNAASTPRTHMVMLIIALTGMPLVLVYTAYVYSVFKGKVVLTEDSY
jgi:cytochrome d ubiquinol oxidase subunit II